MEKDVIKTRFILNLYLECLKRHISRSYVGLYFKGRRLQR